MTIDGLGDLGNFAVDGLTDIGQTIGNGFKDAGESIVDGLSSKKTRDYSISCLRWPLQKKTKIGFQERLSFNAG